METKRDKKGKRDKERQEENPPHIFWAADHVVQRMLETQHDQKIDKKKRDTMKDKKAKDAMKDIKGPCYAVYAGDIARPGRRGKTHTHAT